MSIRTILANIFMGPVAMQPKEPRLRVTIHMIGGQSITTYNVKEVTITKTPEGGVRSYRIEWHDGQNPAIFSLTLDHISAIHAEEM